MNFNDEEQKLFNEAGINIDNRTYSVEEAKMFANKIVEHIMSFSKQEIPVVKSKFDNLLYKIS